MFDYFTPALPGDILISANVRWSVTKHSKGGTMRVRLGGIVGPCVVVLLGFALAFSAVAQDKKAAKVENVQGKITLIKKETSTITVDAGTAPRQVMYSASTKFMYGHSEDSKAGTLDKVKMGNFISCSGAMDKGVLMATDCIYRENK